MEGNTYVIENFLLHEGHFPDENMKNLATKQMAHVMDEVKYPWGLMLRKRKPEYMLAMILMAVPILTQFVNLNHSRHIPMKISLQPPAYLGLGDQEIYTFDQPILVYPGTLLKCEVNETPEDIELKDNLKSIYLPTALDESKVSFEIRILKKTHFNLFQSGKLWKNWDVNLLKDHHPGVSWTTPYKGKQSSWKKIKPGFFADDDIALGDAFITVNGDELEYAGSPSGHKTYQYSWEFDPVEHINLEGGNVMLQITVYDQDRVSGPKSSATKSIIWEYAGVYEQTKKTLAKLTELENEIKNRESDLDIKPQPADKNILDKFDELLEEMKQNPVLPDDLSTLAKEMRKDEMLHQQTLENEGPSQKTQIQELEKIKRNKMYNEHIRSTLESILNTVESARLVSELNEASEKLEAGEKLDKGKMEELYQKLADLMHKSQSDPQLTQQTLDKMEQAQLAEMLGQKSEAAQKLKEVAENLRKSSEQSQGSSALAQRFQEKMNALQGLIDDQTLTTTRYHDVIRGEQKSNTFRDQLQKFISDIGKTEPVKKYMDLNNKVRSNPSSEMTQEFFKKLSNPTTIEHQGSRLTQLSQKLAAIDRGRLTPRSAKLTQPGSFNLYQVNEDLKKEYFKIYHNMMSEAYAHSAVSVKKLKPIIKDEQSISENGTEFAREFRQQFQLLLRSPEYFSLADRGAQHAGSALSELREAKPQASSYMNLALQNWLRLQELLRQLQQQARNSGQNSKLSIGSNGKLKMRRKQKIMQGSKEGDDKYNQQRDIELALPEEFQNSKLIEKRLRSELNSIENKEDREVFKNYILNLLE